MTQRRMTGRVKATGNMNGDHLAERCNLTRFRERELTFEWNQISTSSARVQVSTSNTGSTRSRSITHRCVTRR